MWILLLVLSCFFDNPASAGQAAVAEAQKGATDQAVGTTVTSQRMTFKNLESQAIFDGAVVLRRGTLVVYSDHMVVSFRGQEPGGSDPRSTANEEKALSSVKGPDTVSNRAVSQIEATGRVKIERDAGNATCQKAVYFRDEDKIVLTGDPVAWEKGTRVSGNRITMFLAEDRTVVDGGSHVRIEPDEGSK